MKKFLVLAWIALIAVACAPAPTPVPTAAPPTVAPKPAATQPPAATAVPPTAAPTVSLLDAAKKEGKLMIYTSLNAEEFDKVLAPFAKKYPEIKVEFFRGSSEDVTQKALTEFRANTHIADIVETTDVNIVQLLSVGVTGKYLSPETKAYPASAYDAEGAYAAERLNLVVMAYNTNLVKPGDAPKKIEDLLEPKWAGKIALEADDWPMMAYTQKVMGEAKSKDFWTKLAAQKPRVVKGHTELANFLVAGEFHVTPNVYAHRVLSLQDKKAPIEMVKTDTAYAFPHVIAITKNAKNPNAAKVFIDWYLSVEGQESLVAAGRIPLRPGIKTKPEGLLAGFANIFYGDPQTLLKAGDVQKEYQVLFGIK
ncbi:MAG: extracellular solute-binding protein [Chloroflexi bacterium]|nr:extracellular solute-binding protein [Chloroflexota bacterium]